MTFASTKISSLENDYSPDLTSKWMSIKGMSSPEKNGPEKNMCK